MICKHPQSENQGKHMQTRKKCIEDPILHLTYKEAHLVEQTGALCKMHLKIITRAHLSACQRKEHLGEVHQGSAEPLVRTNLDGLPYRCTLGWTGAYSTSSQGDKVSI